MGKGYNNYMCKKPFHPGSKANIKRAWMAEQKTDNEKRKQEDLKLQYEKEQDLYNNKALLSKESKEKLGLNFMYEAPPGAKKERQKEDDEPEYKFEWQRKYNAPREDFAKDNKEIRDQPFGIQVRNVRCIKCHKWGHINTDKECPMFNKSVSSETSGPSMDPLDLMRRMMEEEGLALKQSVLGHRVSTNNPNQQLIQSDNEEDVEMEFLKSLSTKQKRKLLRKLEKLERKKSEKTTKKKKKDSGKKKKHGKSRKERPNDDISSDSTNSSDQDDHEPQVKRKRRNSYDNRTKQYDNSDHRIDRQSDNGSERHERNNDSKNHIKFRRPRSRTRDNDSASRYNERHSSRDKPKPSAREHYRRR